MRMLLSVFMLLLLVACASKWDVGSGSAEIRRIEDEKAR